MEHARRMILIPENHAMLVESHRVQITGNALNRLDSELSQILRKNTEKILKTKKKNGWRIRKYWRDICRNRASTGKLPATRQNTQSKWELQKISERRGGGESARKFRRFDSATRRQNKSTEISECNWPDSSDELPMWVGRNLVVLWLMASRCWTRISWIC